MFGFPVLVSTLAFVSVGLSASLGIGVGEAFADTHGKQVVGAVQGSSTTNYWYGGSLHPLVVERDGVNYLLIGKQVVEAVGSSPTRSYLTADRLGSVRVVTDDQGAVVTSLGYDGDYGATRIRSQSYSAVDDDMASYYRFQGQEQETFPLAELGIENDALAAWLDQLQLYHFPMREYAAGLAAFMQTDPIPRESSLYAALGGNPANFTDETGGMLDADDEKEERDDEEEAEPEETGPPEPLGPYYLEIFTRRHRVAQLISEEAQELIEQLRGNPQIEFSEREWEVLTDLYNEVRDRYNDETNAFQRYARDFDGLFEFGILPPAHDDPDLAVRFRRNLTKGLDKVVRIEQKDWLFVDRGPLMSEKAQQARWKAYMREVRSNAAKQNELRELENYYRDQNTIDAPPASEANAASGNVDAPEVSASAAVSSENDLIERNEQQENEEKAPIHETEGKGTEF